jgi:hypothetical protein
MIGIGSENSLLNSLSKRHLHSRYPNFVSNTDNEDPLIAVREEIGTQGIQAAADLRRCMTRP